MSRPRTITIAGRELSPEDASRFEVVRAVLMGTMSLVQGANKLCMPMLELSRLVNGARSAVIRALELLKRASDVELYTDSQYVKQGIESWIHAWKRNGWKTSDRKPVKNAELWRELDELASRHRIRWHWVRGHNDHPGNERADALANRGVDVVRGRSAAA